MKRQRRNMILYTTLKVHIQTCLLSHLICASAEVEGINHVVTEFFEPEDLD
ncbi:MAG: hypothetical protein IJS00_06440 [Paludibacteraceae bacterium]|nr:hypothetical protein [Paludibacteraceae bacterium]